MSNYKPTTSEDVVYVDYSTSGSCGFPFETSASPTSVASIMRDALIFCAIIPATPRRPGLQPGSIWVSDDFDEPLPNDIWAENG